MVQLTEIVFLYLVKQLGPLLYFEARLWQRALPLKQKIRFLNDRQYKKRINELNPAIYQKFSHNKLVEKSVLSLLGIPTAKFIGYFHPFNGCDTSHQPLNNVDQLTLLLQACLGQSVCFKITEGWGRRFYCRQDHFY